MEISDFIKLVKNMSSEEVEGFLDKLSKYESLDKTLSGVTPDKREGILKKIELFSESDAKDDQIDDHGKYMPEIKKLEFVHVNFTGVGSEWDGGHYGLVWQVNPKFDSFTVIPTTSKKREEYADVFSIGRVLGLPNGETTLLVSDMTRVSRKRISPVKFQHWKKGLVTSRINDAFIPRIEDAISISYGGQTSFEMFLRESTMVAMPADLSPIYSWRFKPIFGRYERSTNMLYYRLSNSDVWHMMQMVNPNSHIRKKEKIDIVKGLFSMNNAVRSAAEAEYKRLYTQQ
ncbi:hypothetical protein [Cytobacillus oceanisediminis]|uniref:hypothetical protein n=1 Tax=Cytobacillus oceanisediminis TaxID=665099 RepID=UPI00203CC099|nr:hypothetical protein [Cytobacillus oceanisediminis]MCM3405931.1 hypothetical protein [Cytobacillus oceanisediminis]